MIIYCLHICGHMKMCACDRQRLFLLSQACLLPRTPFFLLVRAHVHTACYRALPFSCWYGHMYTLLVTALFLFPAGTGTCTHCLLPRSSFFLLVRAHVHTACYRALLYHPCTDTCTPFLTTYTLSVNHLLLYYLQTRICLENTPLLATQRS